MFLFRPSFVRLISSFWHIDSFAPSNDYKINLTRLALAFLKYLPYYFNISRFLVLVNLKNFHILPPKIREEMTSGFSTLYQQFINIDRGFFIKFYLL